jgi:tetratricopeptide (TPR) repeat protein
MRGIAVVLALLVWAPAASAADQPVFAPTPDWVKPAEIPPPAAHQSAASVEVLLEDIQDRVLPDGIDSYFEGADRIQTPQGLEAVGTIALTWNPDTDVLVIHKLKIIRGDTVIDVLASGQKFTVLRRENNLERAILDGGLTAAIEPEGLQVGDILDFAFTRQERDPLLEGRSERTAYLPQTPVRRFRIRESWPDSLSPQWRKSDELDAPKLSVEGHRSELLIDMTDTTPPKPPKFAPARYAEAGRFEFSLSSSWGDVSALMAPLYAKAATLGPNSSLGAEIAAIEAASPDPKLRAAAALRLVQDKVRYVYLGMNNGGYMPAPADLTWARRFGDCKGKTVLLLALLHELGIDAEPALASVGRGDGLDLNLPMVGRFDHVLVRATIGGRVYWLDGTRTGDVDLDRIAVPSFKWALPVRARGAALEALVVPPRTLPDSDTDLRFDASAGVDQPAATHGTWTLRGDEAVAYRLRLANMTPSEVDQFLRNGWHEKYDFIEIKSVDAAFDPASGEEKLTMDGSARMEWKSLSGGWRRYETDGTHLGWRADFDREPGPYHDAPYAVPYPYFNRMRETIVLPNGGAGFSFEGADVDQKVAGRVFRRVSTLDKGVFTTTASVLAVAPEFPASEAPTAKTALDAMNDVTVFVFAEPPAPSSEDAIVTAHRLEPKTAADFSARGAAELATGDLEAAKTDFDHALALNPDLAEAYAGRGVARLSKGDMAGARGDVDKALKRDPKNGVALYAEATVKLAEGQAGEALGICNRAIATLPKLAEGYVARAQIYLALSQPDQALFDLREALRLRPEDPTARALQVRALLAQGHADNALVEADKLAALAPKRYEAHFARGSALLQLQNKSEARQEFQKAIDLAPSAEAYLGLAVSRGDDERKQAFADLDRAQRLSPHWAEPYRQRALLSYKARDFNGEISALNAALQILPVDPDLLGERISAFEDTNRYDRAAADLTRLIAAQPYSARLLSHRCRDRALAKGLLDGALADCEAVLKATPDDDEAREDRAFVYLRMGRFDDAIADYGAVLSRRPNSAIAHFGRGTAELGKHDTTAGKADMAAALSANPNIAIDFNGLAGRSLRPAATSSPVAAPSLPATDPLARGEAHLRKRESAEAIPDFDLAIASKPTARALAERGIAYYWVGDYDKAKADFDSAAALDPKYFVVQHGRGLLDTHAGDYRKAVADFSEAIASTPQDSFAFYWRGAAYQALRDADKAMADYKEALRISPTVDDVYLRRAEIDLAKHDAQAGLEQVDHYQTLHDSNAYAHGLRGRILQALGRPEEARNEMDRSIELQPTMEAYLNRAELRDQDEPDQAQADIAAASLINPKSPTPYRVRAFLSAKRKDYQAAIAALDEALKLAPDDEASQLQMAELHAENHQYDLAIAEMDRLRTAHTDNPTYWNNACWYRAIGGKDLTTALDLCNTAIKAKPEAAGFLDSRGMVYLRLGRLDEAIQDYDAALKLQPKLWGSLFGRAIAKIRKGAGDGAQADIVAVRAADPKIEARFADYGIKP